MGKVVLALVLTSTIGLTSTGAYAVSYTITPFAVPNAQSTTPSSINDQGAIVGTYTDSAGVHSFLYQPVARQWPSRSLLPTKATFSSRE